MKKKKKKVKLQPKQVKTYSFFPLELLVKAGYIMLPNGSFFRKFKNEYGSYRYHAYIVGENLIELHTDKDKKDTKTKRRYHLSSTYLGTEEKRRFREIDPVLLPYSRKKKWVDPTPPEKKRQILDELKKKGLIK